MVNLKKLRPKRYSFIDSKGRTRSFNKKRQYLKALNFEAKGIIKLQKARIRIKARKRGLRLEKKRRVLRREEAKIRKKRLPKAIRKGFVMIGGKKVWQLEDPLTGKLLRFTSRKKWFKAVKFYEKKQAKKFVEIAPKMLRAFPTKSEMLRKFEIKNPKKIGSKSLSKILSKSNKYTNKESNEVKKIIKDTSKAITTRDSNQQLVLIQKTKTRIRKVNRNINDKIKTIKQKARTEQELVLKQVTKRKIKPTQKTLRSILARRLNVLMDAIILLGAFKLITQQSAKSLTKQLPSQMIRFQQIQKQKTAQRTLRISKTAQVTAQIPLQAQRTQQLLRNVLISTAIPSAKVLLKSSMGKIVKVPKGVSPKPSKREFRRVPREVQDKFEYLSDLYSRFYGIKAKAGERKKLLRPSRIFTGVEIRKKV